LEDLRLKITPPNEFNDPFEITPHSKTARHLPEMLEAARTNPQSYRSVYENMKTDGAFTGSFEEFVVGLPRALSHYHSQYKQLSKAEVRTRDAQVLDDISQELGILCLSKVSSSIPMWSYYANHHRGVVIGLDIDKIGVRLPGPSGLVNYRKNRAWVDPFLMPRSEASRQQRLKTLFTKSHEWKHEQEYRRVFLLTDLISTLPEKGQIKIYFLDVSRDAITEVIFGCRISDELENRISQELHRRKKTFGHIRLFRCVKHPSKYRLTVVEAR
jgi:hypothetical protein